MSKLHYCYGKWNSGQDFIKLVKFPKATTRQNGTSHCMVTILEGPYRVEGRPVPTHELGKCLSEKLWKWFVKVGLIIIVLSIVYITGYL